MLLRIKQDFRGAKEFAAARYYEYARTKAARKDRLAENKDFTRTGRNGGDDPLARMMMIVNGTTVRKPAAASVS